MKRWITIRVAVALMAACALSASAVDVDEQGGVWVIETDSYTVHWKEAAQAGYSQVFPEAGGNISVFGAGQGRNLYHSANYAGWVDWGAAVDAEEIENASGQLIMQYTMDDGNSKHYIVTATYWDGVQYWKHEVVVEAQQDVVSFSDGHEPMVEPRNGMVNEFLNWADPLQHVAFANDEGYFALYTEMGQASPAAAWAPDGRMQLDHAAQGKQIDDGDVSDPIVYYMATGLGGLDDAHDLAEVVTDEPAVLSVNAKGKLTTTWGELKR